MTTLSIKQEAAKTAYENADPSGKKLLVDLFGSKELGLKIQDRIKTFEDALALYPPSDNLKLFLDYNGIDKDMLAAQAWAKMGIIAKALNEGWTPDWTNSDQYKYYPWFNMNTGSGLSYHGYLYVHSYTLVGSRLVFKSEELATYAGQQFIDIYSQFLTL